MRQARLRVDTATDYARGIRTFLNERNGHPPRHYRETYDTQVSPTGEPATTGWPITRSSREAGHLVACYAGNDEQPTVPALHHTGIALDELALVGEHAFRDPGQHGKSFRCGCIRLRSAYDLGANAVTPEVRLTTLITDVS